MLSLYIHSPLLVSSAWHPLIGAGFAETDEQPMMVVHGASLPSLWQHLIGRAAPQRGPSQKGGEGALKLALIYFVTALASLKIMFTSPLKNEHIDASLSVFGMKQCDVEVKEGKDMKLI